MGKRIRELNNFVCSKCSIEDCEERIRSNSCDSVKILGDLWEVYNNLPVGSQRDYISDDIFDILASLLRVVLKSRAECDENEINDRVGRIFN